MSTNYRCHGCYWKEMYHEKEESYPICTRKWGMLDAINECCKPGPCPHYMSQTEADKCIDTFMKG